MDPKAMEPQGLALRAFFEGDLDAKLIIHRDDGVDDPMRVSHFFRDLSEFTGIETEAIDFCSGRVLDVGAGTGLHSLVLQQKGLAVTAIDISSQAVAIMAQQGVKDVRCADIFGFDGGPFATILMLGHGIGMVETIGGLGRFLTHARGLASKNGQVLLDSQDVRLTDDPGHLSYHEANRRAGRYIGEIRLRLSFLGKTGPSCGWLHVDPETLSEQAEATGWESTVVRHEESGHYLAKLERL